MDIRRTAIFFLWTVCVVPVTKAHGTLEFVNKDESKEISAKDEGQPHALVELKKEASDQTETPTRKQISFEEEDQKVKVLGQDNSNQNAEDDGQGNEDAKMAEETTQRVQAFYNQLVNNMRRNGQKFNPSQAFDLGQSDDGKLWPSPPYDNSLETPQSNAKNLKNLNSLPIHLSFGANGDVAVPIGKMKTQGDSSNINQQEMTPSMLENVMYDGLTSVQGGSSQAGGSQGVLDAGAGFGRMRIQGNTTEKASSGTATKKDAGL